MDQNNDSPKPPVFYNHKEWNMLYNPFEHPYPNVKQGARRIDLGQGPPGRWAYPTEGKQGQHLYKIVKLYYEKDPSTRSIVRTAGGKGNVKELNAEGVTLTIQEGARLAMLLIDWLEYEGIPMDTIRSTDKQNV